MIRINLLSEGRRPVIARRTRPKLSLGDTDPSGPILALGAIAGLVVIVIWWFLINAEMKDVDSKLAQSRREFEELRPIIEEVDAFKAKQGELERKIGVIHDLSRKQQGPVHILDLVSRALPDLLWLEKLDLKGTTVHLRGRAFNTNAIAAFIENLDKVPEFKEPDTKAVQRAGGGATYSFNISFSFVQKIPEEAPTI